MTPLASQIFRDRSLEIASYLENAVFFECTNLVPMAFHMADTDNLKSVPLEGARRPAWGNTWIEFVHMGFRVAGWFVKKPGSDLWHVTCLADTELGPHIIGMTSVGRHKTPSGFFTGTMIVRTVQTRTRDQESHARSWCIGITETCIAHVQMINQPRLLEYRRHKTDRKILPRIPEEHRDRMVTWRECVIRPGAHGVVTIGGVKTGRHMPLHFVRRHYRPKMGIWIESYWRGDPALGIVHKIYAPLPPPGMFIQ